jgi:phage gp45-like
MRLKNITKSNRIIFNKLGEKIIVKPNEIIEINPKIMEGLYNSFKEVKTEIKRRKVKK